MVACKIVIPRIRTTVPNTAEQTVDATESDLAAPPSSEAEIENRLSISPATKSRIDMMRS
jgi:hypothetical protein